MLRPTLVALAIVAAGAFSATTAFGQASIEELAIQPNSTNSNGRGISGDGGTVVGWSGGVDPSPYRWRAGTTLGLAHLPGYGWGAEANSVSFDGSVIVGRAIGSSGSRAVRWTSVGVEALPTGPFGGAWVAARGVSSDGKVVVGECSVSTTDVHACLWDQTGIRILGTLNPQGGSSRARGVSRDGSVAVGVTSVASGVDRAFRWEDGVMEELVGFHSSEPCDPYDVSAEGKAIVGCWSANFKRAFRWTRETGMQELPILAFGPNLECRAFGVSDDGRTVVGHSYQDNQGEGGPACLWRDGMPRQLWDFLKNDCSLDPASQGWYSFESVMDCSSNGAVLTGWGIKFVPPNKYHQAPFRITIPRLNNPPVIEGPVEDGGTVVAREGGLLTVQVEGWDRDFGDALTLEVDGLPPGATLTPAEGTRRTATEQAPFVATFEWTPGSDDVGVPHDVTISFRDEMNGVASLTFTIETISNDAPTIAPIVPVTIECVDGDHLVKLSTTVDDPDGDPLTVTWKVNGEVVETQSVAAGETVEYEGDYEHGESVVEVVASDGLLETTATTTVTVQDTIDPIVTVTPDVDLTTDPGKAFASTSRLPLPIAEDASGHAVTFENDAPATLPLGEHVVTWTATDIGGNEVTATQIVNVVDKEKPVIGAQPAIRTYCDSGKTYATVRLKKPKATDNVPGKIAVATAASSRFEIGTTRVVWTAIDAAGNVARKTQRVTVENRKPKANAGRDVVVTTKSEKGAQVVLDGSASSDPDKHVLKFSWSAKGTKLSQATTAKPSGLFKVGTTTVTLTVTDAGKAKDTDTVRVTVKLKNGRKRSFGEAANASFAQASRAAGNVAAHNQPNGALLRGFAYAHAASGLGAAAGEFVRWEEGQSEADAHLAYSELRLLQKAYGEAAANDLLRVYAETGDESLLAAYAQAAYGSAYAGADLSEP